MARICQQILVVLEALGQTQQRDKRTFDPQVATHNAVVKIGDSVYTAHHDRQNKQQRKAIGPFVVVDIDADAPTLVIYVDGEEKRVSSDHVAPSPRLFTTDSVPDPLLDGVGNASHLWQPPTKRGRRPPGLTPNT